MPAAQGSEDGAQAVLGSIMEVLTFMCFTLPPECCAYWVGEVGKPVAEAELVCASTSSARAARVAPAAACLMKSRRVVLSMALPPW